MRVKIIEFWSAEEGAFLLKLRGHLHAADWLSEPTFALR